LRGKGKGGWSDRPPQAFPPRTAKEKKGDVMNLKSLFVIGAVGVLGATGVA
jgi:hypothetical protein